jgi:hypothetical protein
MARWNFTNAGVILCTLGAAAWGFREAFLKMNPQAEIKWGALSYSLLISGFVFTAVGVLAFLVPPMLGLGRPLKEIVDNITSRAKDSPHLHKFAEPSDLAALHEIYSHHFGKDVPSVELMRSWMKRCKTAFTLIYRETRKPGLFTSRKLVGSFKVLPLTTSGVKALQHGQATGASFKPEHICATENGASAYYIGDLFATDRIAKAVALYELQAYCTKISSPSVTFYARPLSAEGRRVMIRRGFVQLADGKSQPEIGRLCFLDLSS